jgi:arylamine N-acetyltransferase
MIQTILQYLGIEKEKPSLEYLQTLITTYSATVPWESLSRILRKDKFIEPEKCIKLENEFWNDAIKLGTGGTCYESNLAFEFLLKSLGFKTYLTINKIKDKNSLHSAIIVSVDSKKYLVDIGYPLYAPIPINRNKVSVIQLNQIEYRSTYLSDEKYLVENYPHPKPYLYHLTDKPISTKEYLQICIDDYGENGLFLDRIIIRKVKKGIPTRFDSEDLPYNIHLLQNGQKSKKLLHEEKMILTLSEYYNINIDIIKEVFKLQITKTESEN